MPDFVPLPKGAFESPPNAGNPRYGFGSSMPLGAYFVLVTVLWWGLGVLFEVLDVQHVDGTYLAIRAFVALLFGGAMTALMARRQRRAGGAAAIRSMHAAVKTGRLPKDADAATWKPALEYRERQLQKNRWAFPLLFGVFAVLGVVVTVTESSSVGLGASTAVLFVALTVWQEVLIARQLPHTRQLLQQLAARGGSPPSWS